MRGVVAVVIGGLLLAGCDVAGRSVLDSYTALPPTAYAAEDGTAFVIHDNPAENQLMIEPRPASEAPASGVQTVLPVPVLKRAVSGYLASTGRDCKVADGYAASHPAWLFKYTCVPPPPPPPPPMKKKRKG